MPRLQSILRQPLDCGGYVETGDGDKARVSLPVRELTARDLRELAVACVDAARQMDSESEAPV